MTSRQIQPGAPAVASRAWLDLLRRVRYPRHYGWYLVTSTLDVLTTYIVIEVYKGWEANKIAAHIFEEYSWPGMIALKYATVLVVVLVCEAVGSRRFRLGWRLAALAVIVGALPVLLGSIQIWIWFGGYIRHVPAP